MPLCCLSALLAERGFICAEVMKYEELKELGTENAVKAAGKYRQQGKEYVVTDGDIIYFKVRATAVRHFLSLGYRIGQCRRKEWEARGRLAFIRQR